MELDKIILKKFFFGNSYQIEKSLLDILELYNAKNLNVSLNKITFQGPSSIKTLITHPLVGIKEGCIKIQDNYLLIKLSVPDLLIGFYTVVVFMVAIFFMFLYLDAKHVEEYVFFFLFECFILSGYFFNRWFLTHKFMKMLKKALKEK